MISRPTVETETVRSFRIATWNLNNRVGNTTFRAEAAHAAIALCADVLVFTEYFPQANEVGFSDALRIAGWKFQEKSEGTVEKTNRVLIASRFPIERTNIASPDFDLQFPANVLGVRLKDLDVFILAVRIPWYEGESGGLVRRAWEWLATTADALVDGRSLILGDLNAEVSSGRARGGDVLRKILQTGWTRAQPESGASYVSASGETSEIDHILASGMCNLVAPRYVTAIAGHILAGGKDAISDHAALVAEVALLTTMTPGS